MRVCDSPACGEQAIARIDFVQDTFYESDRVTDSFDICGKHFHDIKELMGEP